MTKTPLAIHRQVDDFRQEIFFKKNWNNHSNEVVAFLPYFQVTIKWYVKWCVDKYGAPPLNEYVVGPSANYIPNWNKTLLDGTWYNFAKEDNIEIASVLKDNINKFGLPYLNTFSDKKSAIEYCLATNTLHYQAPMLFDFAYMLADKQLAEKILIWFDTYKKVSPSSWQDYTLRDIEDRKRVLNNWA